MRVMGAISKKWQNCEVVSVNGESRFRVTGACKERVFDLTLDQLMECIIDLDFNSCSNEEIKALNEEARRSIVKHPTM